MHILTKRGNLDNIITYEHICDTTEDMAFIEQKYITLGSTCVVLQGEGGGMEVYMADSNKEWHDIMVTGGNEMTTAGLELHVCTAAEVQNGKPNIETPLESTLYLVPSGSESGNLYDEYIYVNEQWELFGGARVNMDGYATESWVQQQGYLTRVPHATESDYGTIKLGAGLAQIVDAQGHDEGIGVLLAPNSLIKQGTETDWAVPVSGTDAAAFYGLAKAAGDTTQAQSSNAVGTYTDAAKTAIQGMLDVPSTDAIPTKVSDLTNDSGFITFFTETDPTVPAWAKAASKPTYTAAEVGAPTTQEMNSAIATAIGNTLPAPGADGTALVSVNGEWVQQSGYGYSETEDSFVLGEFTSADFVQEGAEYKATIPLTSELLTLLQRMFINHEEFNVTIDSTTYNSVADQFTYTEDPSIYLQDVFRLEPNSGYTALTFSVPTVPSSARIYGSVTTYTQFDSRLLPLNENNLNIENGTGIMAVLINSVSGNTASGNYATAEGQQTTASGDQSHAEGYRTIASQTSSHAEGWDTRADGLYSHTEGANTRSFGWASHAEGYKTVSLASGSHSEGQPLSDYAGRVIIVTGAQNATELTYEDNITPSIDQSAVGIYICLKANNYQYAFRIIGIDTSNQTVQISNSSHPALDHVEAILADNIASSNGAHSEGKGSQALATASHAEGEGTIARTGYQHVQGKYNIEDTNGTYAHIVGNGTSSTRSNAHTLDWNGNAWYAGKVTAGGTPTNANDLTTKQYVDNALAAKVISVEGTTPAITAVADTQYICGEVSTLSFTPSATGTCDVIFESGATATVLTVPSTVKFPEWFDASALDANMTYEISITNGVYGAVMAWPAS